MIHQIHPVQQNICKLRVSLSQVEGIVTEPPWVLLQDFQAALSMYPLCWFFYDRFFLLFYIDAIHCTNYISITMCILISSISIRSHSSQIHGSVSLTHLP